MGRKEQRKEIKDALQFFWRGTGDGTVFGSFPRNPRLKFTEKLDRYF